MDKFRIPWNRYPGTDTPWNSSARAFARLHSFLPTKRSVGLLTVNQRIGPKDRFTHHGCAINDSSSTSTAEAVVLTADSIAELLEGEKERAIGLLPSIVEEAADEPKKLVSFRKVRRNVIR